MKLIAITGMHRSNTSALAKTFFDSGYEMGDNLMEASINNPKGYFEDKDIIALEDRLITKLTHNKFKYWYIDKDVTLDYTALDESDYEEGRTMVMDKASLTKVFIWKSPRTTLLLDYWKSLFPELHYIFVFRHYKLVAKSLVKRGDMWKFSKVRPIQTKIAMDVWLKYNLEILRFLENREALLLKAPDLFLNEISELRLNKYLAKSLDTDFIPVMLQDNFDDNLLKTQEPKLNIFEKLITSRHEQLYQQLNKIL